MQFQALADWLNATVPADYQPGSEVPDVPAPYVMLTEVPGPGLRVEDAIDTVAWQVRCAAAQGITEAESYEASRLLAMAVDRRIVTAPWPLQVGAVTVRAAQRLGSRPRFLTRFDDDTVHFAATYLFDVPSGY